MTRKAIRVLVVEDHGALAENLLEFLGEKHYALDFAPDGLTALHLIATSEFDVIVLDVMLPGVSGFELCRRIRDDMRCTTPIILMTAKDSIEDKTEGFTSGADDYLVKPFHLQELALRIDALHRRYQGGDSLLRAGSITFDPGTLRVGVEGGKSLRLSGIAVEIFEALVRAYPNYVSYEQLSETLWNGREVESATLRTHMYMLRKQLHDHLGDPLIKTLHGRGYLLTPPGER